MREPLLVLDGQLRVITANRTFCETFKLKRKDVEGQGLFDVDGGAWNIPKVRMMLDEVLNTGIETMNEPLDHDFKGIGQKQLLVNVRPMHSPGAGSLILLVIEDLNGRRMTEQRCARPRACSNRSLTMPWSE